MANEIQADPVQLRKYADEIGKINTGLRNGLMTSKAQVDSLKGVWTGEAAETFNVSFSKLLEQCSEGLNTVGHMVTALFESADAYDRNEKTVKQEASKMPKLPSNTMR